MRDFNIRHNFKSEITIMFYNAHKKNHILQLSFL